MNGALILIVEDNEANQLLARAVLEMAGYRVDVAGAAPDALKRLSARTPDLILMDLQLPRAGRPGVHAAAQGQPENRRNTDRGRDRARDEGRSRGCFGGRVRGIHRQADRHPHVRRDGASVHSAWVTGRLEGWLISGSSLPFIRTRPPR